MPRDTVAPHSRDPRATIRLRRDRFELMTRIVGATTWQARADLLDMDRKTLQRARQGVFGLAFMAQAVSALERHAELLATCGVTPTLNDLFEVVDSDVDSGQVAA